MDIFYKTSYNSPVGLLTLCVCNDKLVGAWLEGQKYFCPNNVEAYLNYKYNGNYMNFPKFINNVTNGEIKYLKDLHKEIS